MSECPLAPSFCALILSLTIPPHHHGLFPSRRNGCKVGHYPHSLGNSDGAIYFLYSHKEEPSGKLRCSGHNLAGSGEKFSFSSLVDG